MHLLDFSAISAKGDNQCVFQFAFLQTTLKEIRICSQRTQTSLFRVNPISEGRQKIPGLSPQKMHPFFLKGKVITCSHIVTYIIVYLPSSVT